MYKNACFCKLFEEWDQLIFDLFSLETSQLRAELVTCSEDRDELSRSLSQWREKVHNLEKTNGDTRSLISILEDDIRAGRKEYEALQSSMDKLNTKKIQVLKHLPFYTFFDGELF